MTRQDFLQLVSYLQRMEKMMAAVVNLVNTVDPNLLADEDDVIAGAAPVNSQPIQTTPQPVNAQQAAIANLPESVKKKVVITNPELNSLVKEINAQREEEVAQIAAASGIIKREAPFPVEITYIDRTDDLQPIAKILDTKHGYYNFIPVSKEEADAIQQMLDNKESPGIELTQAELDQMTDKWIPIQKVTE